MVLYFFRCKHLEEIDDFETLVVMRFVHGCELSSGCYLKSVLSLDSKTAVRREREGTWPMSHRGLSV